MSIGEVGEGGYTLEADDVDWDPAWRVIASEYAGANLFDRAASAEHLAALQEIADLTNPAARAAVGEIELVPPEERIYGPGAGRIMAAFTHPGRGSRFSDGKRGTFYATRAPLTAAAEWGHHHARRLGESGSGPVITEATLLRVTLRATLVDVRARCSQPPGLYHDSDYGAGQALGRLVRDLRGDGIVYDSLRDRGGVCAALFRPRVLSECRPGGTVRYLWNGAALAAPTLDVPTPT